MEEGKRVTEPSIDISMAEVYFRQARLAHDGGDMATFEAARMLCLFNLGLPLVVLGAPKQNRKMR